MKINQLALLVAVLVSLLAMPAYENISPLIGVILFMFVYTAVNIERKLKHEPIAFSSLALMVGCLQLVIAPWLSQYFPHWNPVYNIPADRIGEYIAYTAPLCIALGLGFFAAQRLWAKPLRRGEYLTTVSLDSRTEKAIRSLFWATFALMVIKSRLPVPGSVEFFLVLLSEVAFVCPLLLYIGGRSYWWKLALPVFAWQLILSIGSTVFHSVMLWAAAYFMFYWSMRFRGRNFRYVLLAGLAFVMILQPAKTYYRQHGDGTIGGFISVVANYLSNPAEAYSDDNLSKTLMRLNQGWIVHLVMDRVPSVEPYAGMTIITRQMSGVLLPRFLVEDKYVVGGKEYFEQYTGRDLQNASMGLGYAGEFYAAFGDQGGIFATFLYGMVLATGFEMLKRAARSKPLWWAWGPFLFLVAIKAEDTVGNAVNWAFKGFIIIMLVRYALARIFRHKRNAALPGRADAVAVRHPH